MQIGAAFAFSPCPFIPRRLAILISAVILIALHCTLDKCLLGLIVPFTFALASYQSQKPLLLIKRKVINGIV